MDKNLHRITGNDRLSKYVDSDYLGSGQLELKTDYILTIDKLWQGKISTGGKAEQQVVISFREKTVNGIDVKPMILNATNRRALKTLYGSDSADVLEGKRIILYVEEGVRDPRTGGTTEGLRIRTRRPPDAAQTTYTCADCGERIKDIQGFSAAQIAATTERRYGVTLCSSCSAKRKAEVPTGQQCADSDSGASKLTAVQPDCGVSSEEVKEDVGSDQ